MNNDEVIVLYDLNFVVFYYIVGNNIRKVFYLEL